MSNNIFSGRRLVLLYKQHIILNTQLLLLSAVAYIGVIFIVLSLAQADNSLHPHDRGAFHGFLIGFVAVFGILYAGHAFPAFRSKESTINYLMVPASVLEKFVFEFISRIGVILVMLPVLYWATFHLQGYFFTIFTDETFFPIGLEYLVKVDLPGADYPFLIYALTTTGLLLAFVVAFTGATIFNKQPLVKSLFAVALIVMFFVGYSYIVIEHLGVGRYNPPENMILVPMDELRVLQLVTIGLITTMVVMLYVAFRKLKEREV